MTSNQGDFPDGLEEWHSRRRGSLHHHASVVSIIVLGSVLTAAVAGWLGGHGASTFTISSPQADLSVTTPTTLRNGVFYETRIAITPKQDLSDLVLAVDASLWRDITQNSMIPAAEEETAQDGAYRYGFGAVKAGETLDVKIDSQINPSLFAGNKGKVALYDGDQRLVGTEVRMRVLP